MLKHIIKEFWLPFVLAIVWTVYVSWEKSFDLKIIIASFSPAFFMASWMTGQFFRIKKQESVQSGIKSVESRVEKLLKELEIGTKELIHYTTGGDSFCYFSVGMSGNSSTWTVVHQGKYPLYGVSARIVDLEKFNTNTVFGFPYLGDNKQIGDIGEGQAKQSFMLDFGHANSKDFNVFFSARNGFFTQTIRFRRVNGVWISATKVESMVTATVNNPVLEKIDVDYPRDANGNPEGI